MSNTISTNLIEEYVVETRPGATLEVVRIKLSKYAKTALGVHIHEIPAATTDTVKLVEPLTARETEATQQVTA